MRIEFFNRDHTKVSIRVRTGTTDSGMGLDRGRREVVDGGPNAVTFAWRRGDQRITNEEYDQHSTSPAESTTVVFGTPAGEVGEA